MRLILNKRILTLALVFASAFTAEQAVACGPGLVRSVEFGKVITRSERFCASDGNRVFVSANCAVENKTCQAFKKSRDMLPVPFSELEGEFGSPAAKLCAKLGGEFEIVDFKTSKRWTASDRCVFADTSFVNGAYLLIENDKATELQNAKQDTVLANPFH